MNVKAITLEIKGGVINSSKRSGISYLHPYKQMLKSSGYNIVKNNSSEKNVYNSSCYMVKMGGEKC